jgi:hypothetical protein
MMFQKQIQTHFLKSAHIQDESGALWPCSERGKRKQGGETSASVATREVVRPWV